LASAPAVAAGQEAASSQSPPKVLQIFVESVKPGKGAAHEKVEIGWPAAFRKAKWPTHYLAVTSMSGPGEAWYLTGHESYAALETDNRNVEKTPALSKELERLSQVDGELLSGTRGLLASYRPDLSYRPNIDIAQMRYFALTIITLKPGYDSAYADVRKLVNAGHEKVNMDEHWAMYQVTSGMAGSTYLLFITMKSLQEADLAQESHGKPYQDALGESGRQQLRDFARNAMATSETKLFAFSPKMSYPSPEWVARDPQFWAPKPVAAAKP
ncbi:MAG: hypothetical protein H0T50_03560, partial [Gemmatimonadales bacterium]|nr:hypothetical protein [Gemmatimonadales bacterium]